MVANPLARAHRTPEQRRELRALGEALDPALKRVVPPLTEALGRLSEDRVLPLHMQHLWRTGSVPLPLLSWALSAYREVWHRHLAGPVKQMATIGEGSVESIPAVRVTAGEYEMGRASEWPTLQARSQAKAWRLARKEARARGIEADGAPDLLRLVTGLAPEGVVALVAAQAAGEGLRKQVAYRSAYMVAMQKASLRRSTKLHAHKLLHRKATKTAEHELARGYNGAKRLGAIHALKIGLAEEVVRTWITQLDEKVCPICEPLHGRQMVARTPSTLYNAWPGGVGHPPAHINCRCVENYTIRKGATVSAID